MATVQLEDVVKDYGAVRAIHGIKLQIAHGEFVALVGPSGCGKSTLLRMIAGLEEISAGTLRIGDRPMNAVEPRDRDVAMVFQDYALYPHMSVFDNISFPLRMRGMPKAEIKHRVGIAADILQIGHLLERKPAELSGGQRQRVAMGRAMVRKPKVFLFDEPLSNLDAKLRVDMRTQIKRLHAILQTTAVYVTHDQVEAMTLADRIVVLRDGRIEQQDTPTEIYAKPINCFVAEFIGSPRMNFFNGYLKRSGPAAAVCIGNSTVSLGKVDAAEGEAVSLGIRPEHLGATCERPLLRGIVDVIEPLGSDILVVCILDGQEFTARLPADYPVRKGEELGFSVDPARLHLFSQRTGARLAMES